MPDGRPAFKRIVITKNFVPIARCAAHGLVSPINALLSGIRDPHYQLGAVYINIRKKCAVHLLLADWLRISPARRHHLETLRTQEKGIAAALDNGIGGKQPVIQRNTINAED